MFDASNIFFLLFVSPDGPCAHVCGWLDEYRSDRGHAVWHCSLNSRRCLRVERYRAVRETLYSALMVKLFRVLTVNLDKMVDRNILQDNFKNFFIEHDRLPFRLMLSIVIAGDEISTRVVWWSRERSIGSCVIIISGVGEIDWCCWSSLAVWLLKRRIMMMMMTSSDGNDFVSSPMKRCLVRMCLFSF